SAAHTQGDVLSCALSFPGDFTSNVPRSARYHGAGFRPPGVGDMRRRTIWLLLLANVLLAEIGMEVYRGYWPRPDPPLRVGATRADVDEMMEAAGYSQTLGSKGDRAYVRDTGWFGDQRIIYVRYDTTGCVRKYWMPPPDTATGRGGLNRVGW